MPDRFDLSLAAVDILAERLGIDLRLTPLEIPRIGRTVEERSSIAEAVWRALHSQGLAHRGRLDADVEDALLTVARAEVALSLMLGLDGGRREITARLGATARLAVMAMPDQNLLRLRLIQPTEIVSALLSVVPNCRPLAGLRSLSLPRGRPQPAPPADSYDEAEYSGSVLVAARRPASREGRDWETMRRIMGLPRERVGVVQVCGPNGTEQTLMWVDTPEGRYINRPRRQSDGSDWDVYFAADNQRLGAEIAAVITPANR